MRHSGGDQGAGAHGEFEYEAAFRFLGGVTGELGDSLEAIVDGAGTEVQRPSGGGKVARRGDVGLECLDEMLRSSPRPLEGSEDCLDQFCGQGGVGGQDPVGQEFFESGDRARTGQPVGELERLAGFTVDAP